MTLTFDPLDLKLALSITRVQAYVYGFPISSKFIVGTGRTDRRTEYNV